MKVKNCFVIYVLAGLVLVSLYGCDFKNPGGATGTTTAAPAPDTEPPHSSISTTDVKMTRPDETTQASEPTTQPPETTVSTPPVTAPPVTAPPGEHALRIPPPSTDLRGLSDSQVFSFYDDAVFVGDSVSMGWSKYVIKKRSTDPGYMGKAQFLVSGSLGAANALWEYINTNPNDRIENSVHPPFNGEQMYLWESIPLTGAKKVFIMLGLNDVGLYGVDTTVQNFGKLINKIKAGVPDAKFYILSTTYMLKGKIGKLSTDRLRELNIALIDFCANNGYEFINIADALTDADGNLKPEYCSDPNALRIHHTYSAYEIRTALMKGFAASKLAG